MTSAMNDIAEKPPLNRATHNEVYIGWPKLKYSSSKFAKSWQPFGIWLWNLHSR